VPTARDEGGGAPPPGAPRCPCGRRAHVAFAEWMGNTRARRVSARRSVDSDPVCRLGFERGATGGEGRPRSFPSGPPDSVDDY
jgi:hypothetical protein